MTLIRRQKKRFIIELDMQFDQVIVMIILFLCFLNSLSYVMYTQSGASLFWYSSRQYIKLLLVSFNAVYIVGCSIRERKISACPTVISYVLLMSYTYISTVLFFHISFFESFIADAFALPLTLWTYYLFSQRNGFTKLYQGCLVIFCLITSMAFIRTLQLRETLHTNIGSINRLVAYIPLVLLLDNKKIKMFCGTIISLLTLFSLKRGAIICIALGFFAYYFCKISQLGDLSKKARTVILFLLIITLILLLVSYSSIGNDILNRFSSISEDEGSGRTRIWEQVIKQYHNSPLVKKILGHGYHALPIEVKPSGFYMYAHNSYIEFLYDSGVIGFGWLIGIVISMFFSLIRMIKRKKPLAPQGAFAMCIVLVFSLVSYFFEESGTAIMIASFWGVLLGQENNVLKHSNNMQQAVCKYFRLFDKTPVY